MPRFIALPAGPSLLDSEPGGGPGAAVAGAVAGAGDQAVGGGRERPVTDPASEPERVRTDSAGPREAPSYSDGARAVGLPAVRAGCGHAAPADAAPAAQALHAEHDGGALVEPEGDAGPDLALRRDAGSRPGGPESRSR